MKSIISICLLSSLFFMGCARKLSGYDTVHPSASRTDFAAPLIRLEFTTAQRAKLEEALRIAHDAVTDPLFEKIMKAQGAAGVYPWDHGRLSRIDPIHHADPVSFFLAELHTRGLPNISQLIARDTYSDDDVTGSTTPCSEDININVNNLDRASRTPVYVAGTIVHERMHSFCFLHRSNNVNKPYNHCDFAYHAGNVAIVIALYRANGSQPIAQPLPMCKSLLERFQGENIIR